MYRCLRSPAALRIRAPVSVRTYLGHPTQSTQSRAPCRWRASTPWRGIQTDPSTSGHRSSSGSAWRARLTSSSTTSGLPSRQGRHRYAIVTIRDRGMASTTIMFGLIAQAAKVVLMGPQSGPRQAESRFQRTLAAASYAACSGNIFSARSARSRS
jgi:hypothetical protein